MLSQRNGGRGRIPESPCTTVMCAAAGGAPHSRGSARSRRNRAAPEPEGQRRDGPSQAGDPRRRGPHHLRPSPTQSTSTPSSRSSPACSRQARGTTGRESPSSNPCGGMTLTTRPLSLHSRPGTGRDLVWQPLERATRRSKPAQAPRVGVFPNPEPCSGSPAPSLVETHDDERSPIAATWSRTPSGETHRDEEVAQPARADGQVKPARPSPRRLRHASGVERSRAQPPSRLRGRPSEQGPHGYTDDDVTGVVNAGVDA